MPPAGKGPSSTIGATMPVIRNPALPQDVGTVLLNRLPGLFACDAAWIKEPPQGAHTDMHALRDKT